MGRQPLRAPPDAPPRQGGRRSTPPGAGTAPPAPPRPAGCPPGRRSGRGPDPGPRGDRRLLVVQEPLVGPEGAVEPHGVVQGGHVEAARAPQWLHREADGVQQRHVARVRQRAGVHQRVVAQRADRAHPHRAARLRLGDLLARPAQPVHVPDVERLATGHPLQRLGQPAQVLAHLVGDRRQFLGVRDDAGGRQLVLEGRFLGPVEGGRQVEDRPALLHRRDPPRREGAAVAHPLHLVHDRHARSPGAQEVGVQRVHRPVAVGGPAGSDQRLARDLAAEDPLEGLLGAPATEDVDLDPFQVEQVDQELGGVRHALLLHSRRPAVTVAAGLTADPRR